ncbi:hypothetical protein QN372_01305 [Undibacterium sp. RTI2.1]|nr:MULTISPECIES: hypothetical protein [unclassified Undibacterium]MDY7539836.1 hypothetical protein [Undibacterium sp. 5I1]MEB0029375.1 hypothetical protein [Undibacterium sp. RTI2.1]MEB0116007.1 hypothetical protein [Undibacterium sp. RTI2.2]MEB0232326.1 hypothetical protein [Undibacterium sp. 10I3]MEB0256872.1 hypothetical protein [Undibacterium sp. 5I1]
MRTVSPHILILSRLFSIIGAHGAPYFNFWRSANRGYPLPSVHAARLFS